MSSAYSFRPDRSGYQVFDRFGRQIGSVSTSGDGFLARHALSSNAEASFPRLDGAANWLAMTDAAIWHSPEAVEGATEKLAPQQKTAPQTTVLQEVRRRFLIRLTETAITLAFVVLVALLFVKWLLS